MFNNAKVAVNGDGHPVDIPDVQPEVKPLKDYEAMHWKQLKPLVEMYGGTWTTKEDAVKYLRGMNDVVA